MKVHILILYMLDFLQNFLTCLSRVINYILLLQYFWTNSVIFCFMHSLSFKAKSFWLVWVYEKEYNIIYLLKTFYAICFRNYMRQASCFLCLLMSPHRKRDGRYHCIEVFSHELEELRQEPFKNGENTKLGDFKTPLDYTLSVCICLLFVFLSTQFYRINLERLIWYCCSLFLFCFIYIWGRPSYLFILRESYWRFGLIWFGCTERFGIEM
jgi:hypothetical protein